MYKEYTERLDYLNKKINYMKKKNNKNELNNNFLNNIEYPQIKNIVCTINLNSELNLKKIALEARNAEFSPRRFPGAIMRISDPKSTMLVFKSGKVVCTGTKNEYDSYIACRKIARIIQKLGFNVKLSKYRIQNIVSSCSLNFSIDLNKINCYHTNSCKYEPELFPGMVYKLEEPKISVIIFSTGKIIFTGAKSIEDIDNGFLKTFPLLFDCIKSKL